MEPVLIYTDTRSITEAKASLTTMVTYIQQVYDEFKAIGVTVSLADLNQFLHLTLRSDVPLDKTIESFVSTYLLNKAGQQEFNGVPIKIDGLIQIPDLSGILSKLKDYRMNANRPYYFNPDLMQISNDVVSKTDTAFEILEAQYTHYSKNDRGAELATILFSLAQKLNELRTYLDVNPYSSNYDPIPGLEYKDNAYRPDLTFIRRQEASYPNYVMA